MPMRQIPEKKNHLKLSGANFLAILLISIEVVNLFSNKIYAGNFELLRSLSYECLNSRGTSQCGLALEKAEELQLFAGSKDNYSCQTRLLGLESKIIMVMLNMPKGRSFIKNLNEVEKTCSFLF